MTQHQTDLFLPVGSWKPTESAPPTCTDADIAQIVARLVSDFADTTREISRMRQDLSRLRESLLDLRRGL